jgi:predicted dehydrogenase
MGGGAIYDIGIYPLMLCLAALGEPAKIASAGSRAPSGCDWESRAELLYTSGAEAIISCSFRQQLANSCHLYFSKAEAWIEPMWHMPGQVYIKHIGYQARSCGIKWTGNGYSYEAEHFAALVLQRRSASNIASPGFSLSLAHLMQKWMSGF